MFFFHTIRSSNTLVNNQIFKWKIINTWEDKTIKAIWGSDLGWPDDSWERQPTINYFGRFSRKTATNLSWQSARKREKESETMISCSKFLILLVSVIPKMPRVICYKISALVDGYPWVCNKRQKASKIKGSHMSLSPLVWNLIVSNQKEMRRECMLMRRRNNGARLSN